MQLRILHLLAITALAVALASSRPGSALAESQPPLVPVGSAESRLLADAADGSLERHSLLRASLIAGGISDEVELQAWQQRFDDLCRELDERRASGESLSPQTLFEFHHTQMLTGEYNAAVTTLPATLGTGNYNCLTATTLLMALGDRYAIPLEAVSTSGHIYCRYLGEHPLEIETTCRNWLRGGAGRADRAAPLSRFAAPRSINRVQVIAKIYYNRGLALLADKQFAAAFPLLELSRQLDPHDTDARENLLAGLNNWALSLAEREQFAEAARLIARGQSLNPNYPPLSANDLHIHQRWAAWHCDRHEYGAALAVLERGRRRRPDASLFMAGPQAVYAEWIDWHLQRGEKGQAADVLATARRELDREALAKLQAHVSFTIDD